MTRDRSAEARLGIAMPVFNEERWLDTILRRVLARPEVARIVAVDDGSTDGSWNKLQRWAKEDDRVHAIQHAHNRGKGAAIRTALEHLATPFILIQDADLEYDPADYAALLEPILRDEADVVYGSRFPINGRATLPRSPDLPGEMGSAEASPCRGTLHWHTLGNRLLTAACNQLTGLQLTDEATCYKLFKREVLEQIELTEDGFGFCPEVTAKVARMVRAGSVRLREVPITYHGRTNAEGKKIRFRDGVGALRCLWKHR